MAIGDIQHSELPDNLLHEPKGASTAGAGTLYVADGAGSGSFKKVPVSSLDFAKPVVDNVVPAVIEDTASLSGAGLSQPADGVLVDTPAVVGIPQEITVSINKLASELLRVHNNQEAINTKTKQSLMNIETKLNEVVEALKGIGIFNE